MTAQLVEVDSTCATSGATQDITSGSFTGTPTAALVTVLRATVDGTAANEASLCVGASDGSNNAVAAAACEHNQATTDTFAAQANTDSIMLIDPTAGTVEALGTIAMISGGIRISWATHPPSAYRISVLLVGSDNAAVGSFQTAATASGFVDVALGFEPTLVLFFSDRTNTINGGVGANAGFGFGAYNDSDAAQACMNWLSSDAQANTSCGALVRSDRIIKNFNTGGQLTGYTCSTPGATGFRVTNDGGTGQIHICYLALRFASEQSYVGILATPTVTGNAASTAPGFTPQALIFAPNKVTTLSTVETNFNASFLGIGVTDGTTTVTHGITDEDGAGTSNTQSLYATELFSTGSTGGRDQRATHVSFDATGYTLNHSAVEAAARQWLVIAVEEAAAGGSSPGPSLVPIFAPSKPTTSAPTSFPAASGGVPGGSASPPTILSATIPAGATAGNLAASERYLDPIDLQIPSLADDEETFRNAVIQNFRDLEQWLFPYGGRETGLRLLARLLGGQYLEVDVAQVAASENGDTEIPHDLGRIPSQIVLQSDLRGSGGLVRGAPQGGLGSSGTGSNQNAWTKQKIYLRADVTSTYAIVVV